MRLVQCLPEWHHISDWRPVIAEAVVEVNLIVVQHAVRCTSCCNQIGIAPDVRSTLHIARGLVAPWPNRHLNGTWYNIIWWKLILLALWKNRCLPVHIMNRRSNKVGELLNSGNIHFCAIRRARVAACPAPLGGHPFGLVEYFEGQ